jgi:hypothetical protein
MAKQLGAKPLKKVRSDKLVFNNFDGDHLLSLSH